MGILLIIAGAIIYVCSGQSKGAESTGAAVFWIGVVILAINLVTGASCMALSCIGGGK
jgi:hypothetical protein